MQSFPVAFVLMTAKTSALYDAVMNRILEVLREVWPGETVAVTSITMAFELASMRSLREAFPTARSQSCWFHFGQVKIH